MNRVERETRDILLELGIAPNLRGYEHLVTAVLATIETPEIIGYATKVLYPRVARKHDTTASRVERAIRHAIENAMLIAPLHAMQKVFGNTIDPNKGKPTNTHYIAAVAQAVTRRLDEVVPAV